MFPIALYISPLSVQADYQIAADPPQHSYFELLVLLILPQHTLHGKRLFHYCMFSHCCGNSMSTELFPSNGCCTVACLHSCYLSMGLHVTVYSHTEHATEFFIIRTACGDQSPPV
jgi:hypothetical protein